MTTLDVLICGAGAAGLTLAVELARRNVRFRLVDELPGPFRGSRGKGLQPRTLEVFEDLGVVDRLMAVGKPYPPQREYRADGSFQDTQDFALSDPTPAQPYQAPLLIPQFLTEAALRERLAELGHRVEFGCPLTGIRQDGAGVTATIGEEVVNARYLVGADGGRSFVRHALGIGFPGKTLGVRAVVADVTVTGVSRDAWHRFNEGSMEKQIALCPLAGTQMFSLQAPVPLEGDMDLSASGLTTLVQKRTGRSDIEIQSVSWASAFNMNARLADRYRDGHVFLAGDAAHTHPPTGGQGLNTSVQDAYNLGWKLAAAVKGAPDSLLDTYEQERRPIAAHMLGLATKLLEAAKAGSTRRGREVLQLDLCYPSSPLALEKPPRQGGILAGDRAPDSPFRRPSGLPGRLFDLFKGTHWTLVGYEADRLSAITSRRDLHIHAVGVAGDIVDDRGYFRESYGVQPGDWVLVRPDGYVGAIVSSQQTAALEAYLRSVGVETGVEAD